ncbi:MAG: hypothetical protein ACOY3K_05720 [Candidatus Omnitrophota bacterium]
MIASADQKTTQYLSPKAFSRKKLFSHYPWLEKNRIIRGWRETRDMDRPWAGTEGLFIKRKTGLSMARISAVLLLVFCAAGVFVAWSEGGLRTHLQGQNELTQKSGRRLFHEAILLADKNATQRLEIRRMADQMKFLAQFQDQIDLTQLRFDNFRQEHHRVFAAMQGKYKENLASLNIALLEREERIRILTAELERLEKLQAEAAQKEPAPASLTGTARVIGVNKDFEFLMIDQGKKNKIKAGLYVEIYAQNKFVGVGMVEKVYPSVAAVRYLASPKTSKIQVGSEVRISSRKMSS